METDWLPRKPTGEKVVYEEGRNRESWAPFPTPSSSSTQHPCSIMRSEGSRSQCATYSKQFDCFDHSLVGIVPSLSVDHRDYCHGLPEPRLPSAPPSIFPQKPIDLTFPLLQTSHRLGNSLSEPPRPLLFSNQEPPDPFITTLQRGSYNPPKPAVDTSSPTALRLERRQASIRQNTAENAELNPSPRQIRLVHAPPIANGIRLIRPAESLPDKFRHIFAYEFFNAVQSKCFPIAYKSQDNLVVSAPTGSGKTAILEMAICRLAAEKGAQNFKIVYQAPTKALCSEKSRDWEMKFGHVGIHCAELTGDISRHEMGRVRQATIIATTPEKWDSITRNWDDHHKLLQLIRLFLIDEVHILRDPRGATLEAVVSRMKTIGAQVRFVALSATIPNSEDIAIWLGRNHTIQHRPAHRETFGEEMRPIKLQKFVYGIESRNTNPFAFDKTLDTKLRQVILTHSERKPIMVFCLTRNSCQATAKLLVNLWTSCPAADRPWHTSTRKLIVQNRDLQEAVKFGVAFHHGGLEYPDRQAIEKGFLGGLLNVVCCTSTLAVGVNLPCHTVILKGTVGFSDGKVREYSDLEVMQMLGRAGRPQFDTSATAVILTSRENEHKYKKMISGQELLESTLHKSFIGHLNSEIVLRTIRDLPSAKTWVKGTFLYVRMGQNPTHYGLPSSLNADEVEERLEEMCELEIAKLQQVNLISDGFPFHSTEYGRAMARYVVNFDTMKSILELGHGVHIQELLKTLCQGAEFSECRYRGQERAIIRSLNKGEFILYPVRGSLSDPWTKVFLLVQILLGGVEFPGHTNGFAVRELMIEKNAIFERLKRLARCVVDCKASDNDAAGTRSSLELFRSLAAGCWEGSPAQLLQVPKIGPVAMRKLASNGIMTMRQLFELDFSSTERLLSRNPPFGMQVRDSMKSFPRLKLQGKILGRRPAATDVQKSPSVTVRVIIGYDCEIQQPTWPGSRPPPVSFIAETTDGVLHFFWRDSIRKLDPLTGLEFNFPVVIGSHRDSIDLTFSCEEIVGTEVMQTIRHDIPEPEFPTLSELPKYPSACFTQQKHLSASSDDEFDDPDLSDTDLLALGEGPNTLESLRERKCMEKTQESALREKYVEASLPFDGTDSPSNDGRQSQEPARLPNGRWMCNHPCANGVLTSRGKPCLHKCCRDGLKNPIKKYTQRNKRRRSKSEEVTTELAVVFRKNDSAKRPRLIQSQQKGLADRRKHLQFRDCGPGAGKQRDYVDLTTFTNAQGCVGRIGSKGDEALISARDDNNLISQHNRRISIESSNYGEDIFDGDDFPELEELPSNLSKKPGLNATEKTLVVGLRRSQRLSEHQPSHSTPVSSPTQSSKQALQAIYKPGSRNFTWTLEANDQEGVGPTAQDKTVRKQISQGSGLETLQEADGMPKPVNNSDDEEKVRDQPAWVSEIDSFVVNLLKEYVEFLD